MFALWRKLVLPYWSHQELKAGTYCLSTSKDLESWMHIEKFKDSIYEHIL